MQSPRPEVLLAFKRVALLDLVRHGRKAFVDRPQRCFRFELKGGVRCTPTLPRKLSKMCRVVICLGHEILSGHRLLPGDRLHLEPSVELKNEHLTVSGGTTPSDCASFGRHSGSPFHARFIARTRGRRFDVVVEFYDLVDQRYARFGEAFESITLPADGFLIPRYSASSDSESEASVPFQVRTLKPAQVLAARHSEFGRRIPISTPNIVAPANAPSGLSRVILVISEANVVTCLEAESAISVAAAPACDSAS
jgi:hypothetical protein